jgi:hypothetical protein
MAEQKNGLWNTIATLSIGVILGVGAAAWIIHLSPLPGIPDNAESQHDQRLARLEQAVTALTQAPPVSQMNTASPESTCATAPANDETPRQDLAQLIRDELRQALAHESPEAQRTREEALANAAILNSPENHTAYQSASDVVRAALAARRWTEEDKQTFRAAFIQLTNDQRTELMQLLAPAINGGAVEVEVTGPLF